MTTKKSQNTEKKYYCEKCDYYAKRKCDFNKHLKTIKHNSEKYNKIQPRNCHNCLCGKSYLHRSSL